MTPRFDPTRAIIYDLARGQLRDDEGASRLNLPAHLLQTLLEQAGPNASSEFARGLGNEIGRRVADRMGASAESASIESWTEHLGGQLALLGLGDLAVESWGRALVLRMSGTPEQVQSLMPSLLETALQRGLSRDVALVVFRGDGLQNYLVLSPEGAGRAREMAHAGSGLGAVVEALHGGDA